MNRALFPLLVVSIAGALLCSCAGTGQQTLNAWLNSPATQQEIGTLESFAFDLLNAWVASHVGASANPNFAAAEATIIPQVQAKYHVTFAQAQYIVRQAEAAFVTVP